MEEHLIWNISVNYFRIDITDCLRLHERFKVIVNFDFDIKLVRDWGDIIIFPVILEKHIFHLLFEWFQDILLDWLMGLDVFGVFYCLLVLLISLILDLRDSFNFTTLFNEKMTVRIFLIFAIMSLMNEISELCWVSWSKFRNSLVFLRTF